MDGFILSKFEDIVEVVKDIKCFLFLQYKFFLVVLISCIGDFDVVIDLEFILEMNVMMLLIQLLWFNLEFWCIY